MSKGKKNQQSDENMINAAIDGNWLNALALYHGLKHTFANSIIYQYSKPWKKQELADRYGITVNKLTVLIRQLKKQGLAKKINGGQDLFLKSIYKIKPLFNDTARVEHRCTIKLDESDNLESIKIKLYTKLLEKAARQSVWEKPEKRNRDLAHKNSGEPRPVFSYETMGKIFGCSKTQAWRIVQRMKELNLVRTREVKERLRQFGGFIENNSEVVGWFFVVNGWLYVHYGTLLNLLAYPA
jgi:hypothetical protein